MIQLPSLQDLKVRGKAVILRVDFNVPYKTEITKDNFRIKKTVPTVEYLAARGARVVIITHLEKDEQTPSLSVISKGLRRHFFPKLKFVPDLIGSLARRGVDALQSGEMVLLENLRRFPGEIENKENFAKSLASMGDLYINEAFSVSHRNHASIVGVPKFLPSYPGLLFQEEVVRLSAVFNPPKPFLFILGGKKISTKIKLIKKFLKKSNFIFVGGAISNVFLKGKKFPVGASPVEEDALMFIKNLIASKRILLPLDLVVKRGKRKMVVDRESVRAQDIIYDSGPETIKMLNQKIRESKFILWNGPLGYIEGDFREGTRLLARILSRAKGEVIVGGGDTVAFLQSEKLLPFYSFVSTGGGAMLEFLAEGNLPGIEAILKIKNS